MSGKNDLDITNINMELHNQINQTSTFTKNEVVDNLNANVINHQIDLNNNSEKVFSSLELPDNNSEMSDDNDESQHSCEPFSPKSFEELSKGKSITDHYGGIHKTTKSNYYNKINKRERNRIRNITNTKVTDNSASVYYRYYN